ncbi:MAG: RDD family protein [Acidimicrobiales bacterium]
MRFLAWLIDVLVLGVVGGVFLRVLGLNAGRALDFLLNLVYFTYLLGAPRGQTLGCMVMRIRVISLADGGPIGYGRGAIRYLMTIVSTIPLFLGYFWMLWGTEKQTWQDKVAGSVVVPVSQYPISQ